MSDNIRKAVIFLFGAVIGAGATYLVIKDKFESRADAEIESVKDILYKRYEEAKKKADECKNKPPIADMLVNDISEDTKKAYEGLAEHYSVKEEEEAPIVEEPEGARIISQQDFVLNPKGHVQLDMFYYTDGVLADDIIQEVSNPSDYLGENYHDILKNSKEEAMYFTNDKMEADISVVISDLTYQEAKDENPY